MGSWWHGRYPLLRRAKTFWKWLSVEFGSIIRVNPKHQLCETGSGVDVLRLAGACSKANVSLTAGRSWSCVSGKPAALSRVWAEAGCVWAMQQAGGSANPGVSVGQEPSKLWALPLAGVSDPCLIDHLAEESFSPANVVCRAQPLCALPASTLGWSCYLKLFVSKLGTVCCHSWPLRYGNPHIDLHLNCLLFDTCVSQHGLVDPCHWVLRKHGDFCFSNVLPSWDVLEELQWVQRINAIEWYYWGWWFCSCCSVSVP